MQNLKMARLIKKNAFLGLILMSFFSFSLKAGQEEATSFVNETGRALLEAFSYQDIAKKHQMLEILFENKTDTGHIADFTLGTYRRLFNENQKQRYHALFKRYLKALYQSYPLNFDVKGADFEVLSVRQNGMFYDVSCLIDLPEKYRTEDISQVKVNFQLKEDQGSIKLVDFKISEASMASTLKDRVMQMIKDDEEEVEWFLEDFEDLTISNEKNVQ